MQLQNYNKPLTKVGFANVKWMVEQAFLRVYGTDKHVYPTTGDFSNRSNRLCHTIIWGFMLICIIGCSADRDEKITYLCEANSSIKINSEYSLLNEVYHGERLNNGKQCIWETEHLKDFGWNWQLNSEIEGINSFPKVSYGWNSLEKNIQSLQLPLQIHSMLQGDVFYEITSTTTGISTLSLNLWIANILTSEELKITHRIRIWLNGQNIPTELGIFVENDMITGGKDYSIYRSNVPAEWSDIILIPSTPFLKKDWVFIGEILKFLVYQQYLNDNEYLVGIDFGNEIQFGIGETKIINFLVEIQPYYH